MYRIVSLLCLLFPFCSLWALSHAEEAQQIQPELVPFHLGQVTLDRDTRGRDTPFMKNRDKFLRVMAQTNVDNFLYNFRDAFGEPQPDGVVPLGVWDSQTTLLRGHASGHYLSAIAQAYASARTDPALQAVFLQKMNAMVETLYDLARKSGRPRVEGAPFVSDPLEIPPADGKKGFDSDLSKAGIRHDYQNWGQGYISAYPPDQFIMLEKGAGYGTGSHQIWAPYYTLHKILAGLLDCYELGGRSKALEIAENMADWVLRRLGALTEAERNEMWKKYIAGEFGGMNEVLARLARLTGQGRYLSGARLFDNQGFFFGNEKRGGLADKIDTLGGLHANQHIPQITGALESYRAGGKAAYYQIARNFWQICTQGYRYSIGGVAGARRPDNPECFPAEADSLFVNGFSPKGQNETCATYNLLKLTRRLFLLDPTPGYMDYYEQGLYNHILASVAEHDPGNTYHVPLNPGASKTFENAKMDGFTCCNGTALESHTKFQDSIYFRSADNRELYVNLFIPSTLNWAPKGITLSQQTDYPYGDRIRLSLKGSGRFSLKIRIPAWAEKGFTLLINGEDQQLKAPAGTHLSLDRHWQDGDRVELKIPFSFRLEPLADQPNIASLFYGPVLLAAEEAGPLPTWRPLHLDPRRLDQSVTGDPATLRFTIDGIALKPFFEIYTPHSVYFEIREL